MDWLPIGFALMGAGRKPQESELEVRAPGGWSGRLSGDSSTLLVIGVQLAIGLMIYGILEMHQQTITERIEAAINTQRERDVKRHSESLAKQNEILINQVRALEAMNEVLREARVQTYVLSLDEKQRRLLNFNVPQDVIQRRAYFP